MKNKNSHELYLLIAALIFGAFIIGYNAIDSVPICDNIELTEPIETNFTSSVSSDSAAPESASIEEIESELFIPNEEEIIDEPADDDYQYQEQDYENVQPKKATTTQKKTDAKPTSTVKKSNGKVNINTATAKELDTLPGIGPAKAQAIIEYRKQFGPFSSVEELINVSGIGEKTLEKLRDLCCV